MKCPRHLPVSFGRWTFLRDIGAVVNTSIKAFVDGITASVIGALVGAVIVIGIRSIVDIPTALIAILSVLTLIYIKKVQEPAIIAIAAVAGIIIKLMQ
jgi:chromate transporter